MTTSSAAIPSGTRPPSGAGGDRRPRSLQLYDAVRTAHLERIEDPERVTILYRQRRYDFDAALAARLDVRRAGVAGAFAWTLRNRVDVIEIAEPLVAEAAARSLAAILGDRLRAARSGGPRARVVAYAIESLPPAPPPAGAPLRSRLKRAVQSALIGGVWRATDRLALGTELALDVYRRRFRGRWPEHRVIPALPTARLQPGEASPRAPIVVFLGDLSERKGFPQVVAAWPAVQARIAGARLAILGRGAGAGEAQALAARDAAVSVALEPSRDAIFAALAAAKVLVLPSRRTATWREQVGLPIVEGLSSGCLIVTTTETGLAPWLAEHGHAVVDPDDADALSEAMAVALASDRAPDDVLADLPAVDGRRAADRWLRAGLG